VVYKTCWGWLVGTETHWGWLVVTKIENFETHDVDNFASNAT